MLFSAIAGLPADLLPNAGAVAVDWDDGTARDEYYASVLADPRMQAPAPEATTREPSCDGALGKAYPPGGCSTPLGRSARAGRSCRGATRTSSRRLARLWTRFGVRIGATCLSSQLVRDQDGLVACDVLWELPPPGESNSAPLTCNQPKYGFLRSPDRGRPQTSSSGPPCAR